jgi:hypothetical protein
VKIQLIAFQPLRLGHHYRCDFPSWNLAIDRYCQRGNRRLRGEQVARTDRSYADDVLAVARVISSHAGPHTA